MQEVVEIIGIGIGVAGILGLAAVIIAAVMRCPRCRGWHESKEEEDFCCKSKEHGNRKGKT